jgi:hypothetical protein
VVHPDFPELIFDDGNAFTVLFGKQPIEKGCFSGDLYTGHHSDGESMRGCMRASRRHI